jgi:hypothetical protein
MGIQRFPEIENNSSGSTTGLQGTWNASTNTPSLANTDTGKTGLMYQVSVGGTVDFGAGNITFEAKDIVVNNGVIWDKIDATDAVHSVNGNTGAVNLDADDIDDTSTTKKFTSATEKTKLSGIAENATANPNAFDKTADDTDDLTEGASNKFLSTAVQNQISSLELQSANQFVSVWKTDNTGFTNDDQIKLPLTSGGSYDFLVDWGDGKQDRITAYNQAEVTHTYASAGSYTVTISGECDGWRFNNSSYTDKEKLIEIKNCGCLNISNDNAFYGCKKLLFTCSDELNVVGLTNAGALFRDCELTEKVPYFDFSNITSARYMMYECHALTEVPFYNTSALVDGLGMMERCYNLTEVPMFDFSALTNGTNIMKSVGALAGGFSTQNYSDLLIHLDTLTLQNSVNFYVNANYNSAGSTAKSNIISNHSWNFTDAGLE